MKKQRGLSPSSVKTFATCPRMWEAQYIRKIPRGYHKAGVDAHALMQEAINSWTPPTDEVLQRGYHFVASHHREHDVKTEYIIMLDINEQPIFSKTNFNLEKDNAPWGKCESFNSTSDLVCIDGPQAYVYDWKTGQHFVEDNIQLDFIAKCLFARHPEIEGINAALVYTHLGYRKHTREYDRRDDPFTLETRETVEALREAEAKLVTLAADEPSPFKPNPSGLCKYCVATYCPSNPKYDGGR